MVGTERLAARVGRAGLAAGSLLAVDDLLRATADFKRSTLIVRREGSTLQFHSNYAPDGYANAGDFQWKDAPPDVNLADVANSVKQKIDGTSTSGDTSAVQYVLDWGSVTDQGLLSDVPSTLAGVNKAYLLDDNGIAWPLKHEGDTVAFNPPGDGQHEIRSDEEHFTEKLKEALETAHKVEHAAETANENTSNDSTNSHNNTNAQKGGFPWGFAIAAIVVIYLVVRWFRS